MKPKMCFKLLLDLAMTILFVLLMDFQFTGIEIHEIIGLAICGLFFFHNVLNFKWIKAVTSRFFDKRLPVLTKLSYVLNFLLLICVTLIGLSGIFISESLFTNISVGNRDLWITIHRSSAYLGFVLISVHIGFHWKMIMNGMKKMLHIEESNVFRRVFAIIAVILIVFAGIKSSLDHSILSKIFALSSVNSDTNGIAYNNTVTTSDSSSQASTQTKSNIISVSTNTDTDAQSLDNYLDSLTCTGCHRRCSLLYPQCSKGERQAQQAEQKYESTVSSQESDSTTAEDSVISKDSVTSENSSTTEDASTSSDRASSENNSSATDDSSTNTTTQEENSFLNLVGEFLPIMGLYIAGTHYLLKFTHLTK